MKILHLFSNWKWTGPAEPAVNLARIQSEQHEVVFICGSPPDYGVGNDINTHSKERGVEPLEGFRLSKHINLLGNLLDSSKLRRLLRESAFDVIHVHLPNDHLLAGLSRLGLKSKPPVIRSFYGAEGPEPSFRAKVLLKRFTSGAIVISEAGRATLINRFRYPEERTTTIPVGVDTRRFDPERVDRDRTRKEMGLNPDDFVLGIVARMQRHRKFEILLEALGKAMEEEPLLKFLIIGRGTNMEEVAVQPVKQMGLDTRILFPGYLRGERYVAALSALDGAVFLVPGSDGSCRAVREKMAMGLPVIVADIPPLNEMIVEGESGMLVQPTVEGLHGAVLRLVRDREKARIMGQGALERARSRFSLQVQAAQVEAFYRKTIGGPADRG